MIDQAHIAGFIVDTLLVIATGGVLLWKYTKAGAVLLFNFVALHIFVYFVLTKLSFWEIFYTDYHLYLALFGLVIFCAIKAVSRSHALLKFFILLEVALHLVMIISGIAYSRGLINVGHYTAIHDSYPVARILLASFQIVGLVADVDRSNRRGVDVHNNWRSRFRDIVSDYFRRNSSLPRVKGL